MLHPLARFSWPVSAVLVLVLTAAPVGAEAKRAAGDLLQKKNPTEISFLTRDNQLVLTYRYAEVPKKPYVRELYTPGGVQVLRDSPHDHKHHHSLMFAVAVDKVDFWSENPNNGLEVHREFGPAATWGGGKEGLSGASLVERLDWLAPDKKLLAREERTIVVRRGPDLGTNLVSWQTRLEPPPGQAAIQLSGSHYFGLGVRFVVSMDKGGKRFDSVGKSGEAVRGTERLDRAAWSAYTAQADGKPVTVAVFDHPGNPRHPATMFSMVAPFAYLSATLNLNKEPLEVKASAPLVVRYGVAALDGEAAPAKIQQLYDRWVKLPVRSGAKGSE